VEAESEGAVSAIVLMVGGWTSEDGGVEVGQMVIVFGKRNGKCDIADGYCGICQGFKLSQALGKLLAFHLLPRYPTFSKTMGEI